MGSETLKASDEDLRNNIHSMGYLSPFAICLIPKEDPATMGNYAEISPVALLHRYNPLRHQFLPILFSFQAGHGPLVLIRDHREEFRGEFREGGILACVMHGLGDPFALLRRHVRGRKDPLCWIDQEEDEDLAVTRPGGILQVEWLNLMLVRVWECDASVSFGDHVADVLHTRGVPDYHTLESAELKRRRCRLTYVAKP